MQFRKRTFLLLSMLVLLVACSQTIVQSLAEPAEASVSSPLPFEPARVLDLFRSGPAPAAAQSLAEPAAEPATGPRRALAHLDAGEIDDARAAYAPAGRAAFDQRFEAALDRADRGAVVHLFDRFGRPLGFLDQEGAVQWGEGLGKLDLAPVHVQPPAGSRALRLTLDLDLARALDRTLEGVQASIVVVDAYDGAVLYAGSDRRTQRRQEAAALREPLEPASVAKLITTTAALRAGHEVDEDLRSFRCTGMLTLGGTPLYCTGIGGRLTGGLTQALATSCNVAFAAIGHDIGRQAVLDEYAHHGFRIGGAAVPDLLSGRVYDPTLGARDLGDLSIGLNQADMTVLHGAVLARTWIDGDLKAPFLHLAADNSLGNSPQPGELRDPLHGDFTSVEGVLEDEWLPLLHQSLAGVTSRFGTASLVAPEGFPVLMKTGTASTERQGFHTNYIGFAPAAEPKVAFAIRVRRGRTSLRVRRATKALTRQVLRALRDYTEGYSPAPVALVPPRQAHLASSYSASDLPLHAVTAAGAPGS